MFLNLNRVVFFILLWVSLFFNLAFSQNVSNRKEVKYNDLNINTLKGSIVKRSKKTIKLYYDSSERLIQIHVPITKSEFIVDQKIELNECFLYKTDSLFGIDRNKNIYDSILVKGDTIYYQRKYYSKSKSFFLQGELKVLKINRKQNKFEYMHFYIDSTFSFKDCVFFENDILKKRTELQILKTGFFKTDLNNNIYINKISIFWHITNFFFKIDISR